MERISRWTPPAAILAVALAAAGCGGGSSSAPPAESTTAAPADTAAPGNATAGSFGTLTIAGGSAAGTYDVGFCFSSGDANLTLAGAGDDQTIDVEATGGSGTLLVANTANTELTNGTVDGLSFTDETSFTGAGSYDDGTAFTLEGTCVN